MADRKASKGTPKAVAAKGKPVKRAAPVLSATVAKAAKAAAPVKVVVKKAPKPPAPQVKVEVQAAPPPPAPVIEAVEAAVVPPPAAPVVEAVAEETVAVVEEAVTKIQEGSDTMATKTAEAGKTAVDQAQAMFGDFNERAKTAMEKSAKIAQDMTDLTKGNVEAVVASSRAAAKGFEALSREAAEYGRKSFEDVSGALKSFSEVRSPADLFRLQSEYARSYFDAMVAETSKLSEQVIKLAGEVSEPITNRATVAAERVRSIAF